MIKGRRYEHSMIVTNEVDAQDEHDQSYRYLSSLARSTPHASQVLIPSLTKLYLHPPPPLLLSSQDHDGSHIKGLIMNFLHHFYPSLLRIPGFLVEFITPIIKVNQGGEGQKRRCVWLH